MMTTKLKPGKRRIEPHNDGSIRAEGTMAGGAAVVCGDWFRLGGTEMRSGQFDQRRKDSSEAR
jgi:hypothetical protein